VQTTVPLPALSYFDTRAYLFLLLCRSEVSDAIYETLVAGCAELRTHAGSLDDLELPASQDLSFQMATASRLTPILYEKFQGNPRRIKRFMNDLYVRQSVAQRRGIKLEADSIAKLMVIEKLLEKDFDELLRWLAAGQLREQLDSLQEIAAGEAKSLPGGKAGSASKAATGEGDNFSGTMIRWAKLPPALDATDVSGYLTLAASFKGRLLVDESLSEKLRDLAAALTSSSPLERGAVKNDDLKTLPPGDVVELLAYLGRRMQDDPSIQLATVNAIVTIADLHPAEEKEAISALSRLPSQEVKASTVLVLANRAALYDTVLVAWTVNADAQAAKAILSIKKGT